MKCNNELKGKQRLAGAAAAAAAAQCRSAPDVGFGERKRCCY